MVFISENNRQHVNIFKKIKINFKEVANNETSQLESVCHTSVTTCDIGEYYIVLKNTKFA